MGIMDKVSGRAKKAAGDITGSGDTRREGRLEEEKGEKKEQLARDEERADRKADEVDSLERKT